MRFDTGKQLVKRRGKLFCFVNVKRDGFSLNRGKGMLFRKNAMQIRFKNKVTGYLFGKQPDGGGKNSIFNALPIAQLSYSVPDV